MLFDAPVTFTPIGRFFAQQSFECNIAPGGRNGPHEQLFFGETGLPIVRAASRLALGATALRAAAALTRPARWARGSSCGRHTVPAGIAAIGPRGPIAQHGIEGDDHLAHHGNDRDLWLLPRRRPGDGERLQ
jgi:hypothetical protein